MKYISRNIVELAVARDKRTGFELYGRYHTCFVGTPFSAVVEGDHERVESFLAIVDVNMGDNDTRSLLHHACAIHGRKEIVELLLEHGCDVNMLDSHGEAPLHVAVRTDDIEVVKLLLDGGAWPNSADDEQRTPLCNANSVPVAELLVRSGGRPELMKLRRRETDSRGADSQCTADEYDLSADVVRFKASFDPVSVDVTLSSTKFPTACPLDAWVPDDHSDRCQLCSIPFVFCIRRHHCRVCGALICGRCSSKELAINFRASSKEVRHGRKASSIVDFEGENRERLSSASNGVSVVELTDARACDGCFNHSLSAQQVVTQDEMDQIIARQKKRATNDLTNDSEDQTQSYLL